MLHRLATEESEKSETDTLDSDTPRTSMSDVKIDLNDRQSSMSTVFGDGNSQKPSSRSSSPSGSRSPSHSRKPSFPLPFRKSSTGKSMSGSSTSDHEKKKEDGLARWLRDGNVVYKSVGLGLMDLVVGTHLIEVAKEKGVGTQVEGF